MDDQPVTLWTLRKDDDETSCRVRLAPSGIEVDVLKRGALVLTRVFATDDEALGWAAERRMLRESEGWQLAPAEPVQSPTRLA
jgi:hypothetical protein